jgi:F-type H+-transporting ATPase subunit a
MKRIIIFITLILSFSFSSFASSSENKSEPFDPGKMIMEHIGDAHSWHILTYKDKDVAIPLPVILINEGKVDIFMSSKF